MGIRESLKELQKNEKLSVKREVKKELTKITKENIRDKKCTICKNTRAIYFLKGANEGYCKECALEFFDDLKCLRKI